MSNGDIFPARVTAGLTFTAHTVRPAMLAPDWTLYAILRGPMPITLFAVGDGPKHTFFAAPSETAKWAPGTYAYTIRARMGSHAEAHIEEVEGGRLIIAPDVQQLDAGHDAREWAEQALEAVEAVILGRATTGQESYRINNRELRYIPIPDLLRLRDKLRREIDQKRRVAAGNLFGDTLRVKFRRPA